MSYNFHIGQDVVAIKDNCNGNFKKDDVFKVKSLKVGICIHHELMVDIGMHISSHLDNCCTICNAIKTTKDNILWFSSNAFAPLDELTDISELQEVLEQPLFQVK